MNRKNILIVEDEEHISRLIKYNLTQSGYECSVCFSGEEALELLQSETPDLILLDVMLPQIDGLEVCRRIKKQDRLSGIPIIMLTAKGEEIDRIMGFENGADDYVVKPFSPRELTLRIQAILKRAHVAGNESETFEFENLKVDIPRHRVTLKGEEIKLTHMEFKLLITMIERKGRVQTRERLLSDVWDIAANVTTRTIDTHVKRLRKKLGESGKYIETVRGLGYRFKEK